MVTQKSAMATNISSEGFILLDSAMNPISVNPIAMQILVYPLKPDAHKNFSSYLTKRIRSTLFSHRPSARPVLLTRIQSGRRTYWCRSFQVNSMSNGQSQASLVVLLERSSAKLASLSQLGERFHLTTREQEVSEYLRQGMTSKQIATRME